MNFAAIDLGTNSLRLLTVDAGGEVIRRETRIVRLGEGVDASRRLTPQALDRVRRVLQEYAGLMRDDGSTRLRMVATSAARSASNPDDLRAVVKDCLGTELDIIDGHEEAALSFRGATRALAERGVLAPGDTLVVDLGGGSTEFVRGGTDVVAACSVPLGSVRLTERTLHSDPPTPAQVAGASAQIGELLDDAFATVPLTGVANLVGVAGTVTTLTTLALGLRHYDPAQVDGAVLDVAVVRETCDRVLRSSVAQRQSLGDIPSGRADVIGAGALIWDQILGRVTQGTGLTTTITSEADILDGIATSLLR